MSERDEATTDFSFNVQHWDARYAESEENWFFGREPSDMGRMTVAFWRGAHGERSARVLDLGCGEGRDSVHFTRKGFSVTAVDASSAGIRKAERLANDHQVTIDRLLCMDVRQFALTPDYDIFFAHNILQGLGEECLPYLFRLQALTPPGGFNAIRVFTREVETLANRPEFYRFDRNELKFHYRGWKLFYYGEDVIWREPMQDYLSFAGIIAQKQPGRDHE